MRILDSSFGGYLLTQWHHRDLQAYKKGETSMEPLAVYKGHTSVVGDVAWHNLQENIFASVGDDRAMLV